MEIDVADLEFSYEMGKRSSKTYRSASGMPA